jgi:hypothetical protein
MRLIALLYRRKRWRLMMLSVLLKRRRSWRRALILLGKMTWRYKRRGGRWAVAW